MFYFPEACHLYLENKKDTHFLGKANNEITLQIGYNVKNIMVIQAGKKSSK